jgi:hypothetical protein
VRLRSRMSQTRCLLSQMGSGVSRQRALQGISCGLRAHTRPKVCTVPLIDLLFGPSSAPLLPNVPHALRPALHGRPAHCRAWRTGTSWRRRPRPSWWRRVAGGRGGPAFTLQAAIRARHRNVVLRKRHTVIACARRAARSSCSTEN